MLPFSFWLVGFFVGLQLLLGFLASVWFFWVLLGVAEFMLGGLPALLLRFPCADACLGAAVLSRPFLASLLLGSCLAGFDSACLAACCSLL